MGLRGDLDGAFDQAPIPIVGDQQCAKGGQGALAKRGMGTIQAIEHQLPASVHERGLDHRVVGDATIRLEDRRQRQLSRRDRRLADRALLGERRQFVLEGVRILDSGAIEIVEHRDGTNATTTLEENVA